MNPADFLKNKKEGQIRDVKISVADPDPGPFGPLDPGSGTRKKSGSGMNNPDHISESLEKIVCVKMINSLMRIRDGKISDPG
jgi:hypothetical protein